MSINKKSGIYCIENIIDGKKYIGCAKNFNKRWSAHKNLFRNNNHENIYMQRVYNKCGEGIFKYYVIQEIEYNKDIVESMETYWIVFYETYAPFGKGYNLNFGGNGNLFFRHTEESKRKISDSISGSKNPNFGKKFSEEALKNMSESHKKENLSSETLIKMSNGQKGKVTSDITKKKIAKYWRGKKKTFNKSENHVGVSYNEKTKKWRSRIMLNQKEIWLGSFENESDAIIAYENTLESIENGSYIPEDKTKKRKRKGTSSSHIGVYFHKRKQKWIASIAVNKKQMHIGEFLTEEEAIIKYEEVEKKIKDGTFIKDEIKNIYISKELVLKIKQMLEDKNNIELIHDFLSVSISTIKKVRDGKYLNIYGIEGVSDEIKKELKISRKIPLEIIVQINDMLYNGFGAKEIINIFNVSLSTINKVKSGWYDECYNLSKEVL
jgi:group I intron endonuclease